MIDAETSLKEFLSEAETDDDFAAVEELIAENETKNGKPAASSRWLVSTLAELAEAMGFAAQTVYQWRADPTMPGKLGAFSVPEVVQWRLAKAKGGDLAIAKKEQDLELGRIELEQRQLELAKEKGEVLDRADVELVIASAFVEFREVCMSLPDTIGASSPPEMRTFIREEADRLCRGALIALHRRLENMQSEVAESGGE